MLSLNYLLTRLSRLSFLGMMLLTIVLLTGAKLPVQSSFVGQQVQKENSKQVNPFANLSFEENEEIESQDDFEGDGFHFVKNNHLVYSPLSETQFVRINQQSDITGQTANSLHIRFRKLLI
jgi:hypothetical protein